MRVVSCETDLVGGFQFGAALYKELYDRHITTKRGEKQRSFTVLHGEQR